MDALGGSPLDGELFIASRFVVAAIATLPFLASASSGAAVLAGAQVGGLCVVGYATQALVNLSLSQLEHTTSCAQRTQKQRTISVAG